MQRHVKLISTVEPLFSLFIFFPLNVSFDFDFFLISLKNENICIYYLGVLGN